DFHVTGVQTCALPIWKLTGGGASGDDEDEQDEEAERDERDAVAADTRDRDLPRAPGVGSEPVAGPARRMPQTKSSAENVATRGRSEERRVGKGWGGGG